MASKNQSLGWCEEATRWDHPSEGLGYSAGMAGGTRLPESVELLEAHTAKCACGSRLRHCCLPVFQRGGRKNALPLGSRQAQPGTHSCVHPQEAGRQRNCYTMGSQLDLASTSQACVPEAWFPGWHCGDMVGLRNAAYPCKCGSAGNTGTLPPSSSSLPALCECWVLLPMHASQ